MDYPCVSVIIACLNEEKFISSCIDSVIAQDYPGKTEIILADGGSTDKTIDIIHDYIEQFNNIRLVNNPETNQAAGRNIAIKAAEYPYIAYLDAHSCADEKWLSQLWDAFSKKLKDDEKIIAVGSIYKDASGSAFTLASETALTSIFSGAGNASYQNKNNIEKVNNAYACIYDKEKLISAGLYDEDLYTGEDMELNQRLTEKLGFSIYVNPAAITYYHRPESISALFRQQFRYGKWRIRVMGKLGEYSPKVFLPGIFVLTFIFILLISFVNYLAIFSFLTLLSLYILAIIIISLFVAVQKKMSPLHFIAIFPAIHWGYGCGVIAGLFTDLTGRWN